MVLERNTRLAGFVQDARLVLVLVSLVSALLAAPFAVTEAATAKKKPVASEPERTLQASIRAGKQGGLRWSNIADLRSDLERLYTSRKYGHLWIEEGVPTAAARALVQRLALADSLGLDPEDYDAPKLVRTAARISSAAASRPDAEEMAHFDLSLSVAALRYASALHHGRIDPKAAGSDFGEAREPWNASDVVLALRDADRQSEVLQALDPPYAHYRALIDLLSRYRALAKDPTYDKGLDLPENGRPGMWLPAPWKLRERLEATGDLKPLGKPVVEKKKKKKSKKDKQATPEAPNPERPGVYGEVLADGVQRFQRRHGQLPDGILWPNTIDELERPFRDRAHQISLAIERVRQLPPPSDKAPIVVNLAAFRLYAPTELPDKETNGLAMDVLVGAAGPRQTPVFSGSMKYLVFRPYWELPLDIMLYEFGPRAEWDAENLEAAGFVLVDDSGRDTTRLPLTPQNLDRLGKGLRMRQMPGPDNALGLVKFMFPNPYDIYLHDTSVPGLFAFARRDMSHGCIRVSEPERLAAHVLRDMPEWTPEKINETMQGSVDNVRVNLTEPIPVLILYSTAEATESGEAYFYADVYGLDKKLDELLRKGYPYPRSGARSRPLSQGRISTEVPSGTTR